MPFGSPRRRPSRCSKRSREVGGWKGRQALGSTITLEATPQLLFSCSPAAVKEFHFLREKKKTQSQLVILAQKGSIPIGNLLSKQWFIVWKWNGGTKYFRETLFLFNLRQNTCLFLTFLLLWTSQAFVTKKKQQLNFAETFCSGQYHFSWHAELLKTNSDAQLAEEETI